MSTMTVAQSAQSQKIPVSDLSDESSDAKFKVSALEEVKTFKVYSSEGRDLLNNLTEKEADAAIRKLNKKNPSLTYSKKIDGGTKLVNRLELDEQEANCVIKQTFHNAHAIEAAAPDEQEKIEKLNVNLSSIVLMIALTDKYNKKSMSIDNDKGVFTSKIIFSKKTGCDFFKNDAVKAFFLESYKKSTKPN